ncbi:MAG: hypothetical protein HQL53_03495 [Magnetococcales bacterium]|nr:hypothetical protein [Magnetococcales bacterium]
MTQSLQLALAAMQKTEARQNMDLSRPLVEVLTHWSAESQSPLHNLARLMADWVRRWEVPLLCETPAPLASMRYALQANGRWRPIENWSKTVERFNKAARRLALRRWQLKHQRRARKTGQTMLGSDPTPALTELILQDTEFLHDWALQQEISCAELKAGWWPDSHPLLTI